MVKVSVIIPVYNGEDHLHQCLDSVCGQTLQDIEIICVDDGSTDRSYEILKAYQDKDDRIQIYCQKNCYAGAARNLGKSHAVGEYLAFWDCDDFFELQALERMYERAKQTDADVCVCGANQYFQGLEKLFPTSSYCNRKKIPDTEVFNRKTNEDHILNFTTAAPWNKLYRRTFIEAWDLDFQEVRHGNDVYFTMNAMCLAERVTAVPEALINYRRNQGQGLTDSLSKTPADPIHAFMEAARNLEKHNALPERSFANRALTNMIYLLHNIKEREAFLSAVSMLQTEGLSVMHIREQGEGYYYSERNAGILQHLIHDEPEDFMAFFMNATYMELTEVSAKGRLKGQQIKKLKRKNNVVKQKNAELNEKVAALESKNTHLIKKNANLGAKNDKLKQKNAELKQKDTELKQIEKQLQKAEEELKKREEEISAIKRSWSYRIGQKIVWLPGKVKRIGQ